MALLGQGVLAIWNGIAPDAEDEFVAWHIREHIPERVGLPGFLRGRRYVAVDGTPKYFNFYETATFADLSSRSYQERLNAPTEWTRRVVRHFTDTSRTACHVAASLGCGEGAFVETLRLSGSVPPPSFRTAMAARLARVLDAAGIVAAHLLEGVREASATSTAEKQLRSRPDQMVDWVMLIEAIDAESLWLLRERAGSDGALAEAGATAIMRGCYRLQFGLSKDELTDGQPPPVRRTDLHSVPGKDPP